MSKKPKPKRAGVKELLELLGADPNEAVPTGLREAEFLYSMEMDDQKPIQLDRCQKSGKVGFQSETQAKAAAKRRLQKGSNVSRLRVYRCPDCSRWHFTSSFRAS